MPKYLQNAFFLTLFLLILLGMGREIFIALRYPIAQYREQIALPLSTVATSPEASLEIYAVYIAKTVPLKSPFIGYGVYLGQGAVLTAAHVVGRWPFITNPRVLIAGRDLAARVLKNGATEQIDLAILTIDEKELPVSLRLRRNPLCKTAPWVGANVSVVIPKKTASSHIISPQLIAAQYRTRFASLISTVAGPSGSGVFHTEKKCLFGIMSRQIPKYRFREENGQVVGEADGHAGYFVSSERIFDFLPEKYRL